MVPLCECEQYRLGSQSGSLGSLTDGVVLQRGMLAQLAARLRARQGSGADVDGGVVVGEEGETVLVDDNCTVGLVFTAGGDSENAD